MWPRRDADAARRAASARRPSLSNAIVNPFAAEGEPAKASSPKADSDVSMEDVSVKVLNAPSLPPAPVYRGSTYEDRRVFMKQYERYTTALTAFQNPTNQPFCMPVSACIEGDTRQRIALFEFGSSPHEITEEQWVNYFLQAKVSTFRNYVAIDAEMKTLKMDVSLREAPSRMSRLTRDLYVKLEAHNVLQEMFTEAPRRIVGYLLEALEPEGFRELVRHQLTLETHKAKKKQIVPFCKWVSGMLEQYMQWNDLARQQKLTPNVKTDDKAKKSAKPPKPAGAGSTGAASTGPAVAPRLETKHPALPCLKCNSPEHSARHCPRAQPGEAAALVAEARARRHATNLSTKRVQSSARNVLTPPSASGVERGTVPANIDGLDVNATLLDSGSDESLVARAVIKALEDRGVEIEVCKPAMPARLIPVGKQAVMAPRCVRFKRISFVTSAGLLILRNHCCWVDESDDDLSLNIGRPTMEQLGYSVDGLLVAALAKQSEYISDTKLPDTPRVSTAANAASPTRRML